MLPPFFYKVDDLHDEEDLHGLLKQAYSKKRGRNLVRYSFIILGRFGLKIAAIAGRIKP